MRLLGCFIGLGLAVRATIGAVWGVVTWQDIHEDPVVR